LNAVDLSESAGVFAKELAEENIAVEDVFFFFGVKSTFQISGLSSPAKKYPVASD
jgi:hypothetical protein